jgi:hypothetical protein
VCSVTAGKPDLNFHATPAPNGSWDWNCDGCTEWYYAVAGFISNGDQACNCAGLGNTACLDDEACSPKPCGMLGNIQSCQDHPTNMGGCWYADNISQPSSQGGCGQLVAGRNCWWSPGSNKCMGGAGFNGEPQLCR